MKIKDEINHYLSKHNLTPDALAKSLNMSLEEFQKHDDQYIMSMIRARDHDPLSHIKIGQPGYKDFKGRL